MIIGPKYKICKRLGSSIFEKCQTQKFQISEARGGKIKKSGPGGKKGGRGGSEYQKQLLEKQKLRLTYGLNEKQFSRYVHEALATAKSGVSGGNPKETLFALLESRLDSIAYRMGLAPTRRGARQLVSHGHVTVNGRRITVPSYQVGAGNAVAVREASRGSALFANAGERLAEHKAPAWIAFDPAILAGSLKNAPAFGEHESSADIQAVFEYYTR